MKSLRLLGLLLMIGLSFAMPALAGQKDTSSKTKALNKEAQELLEAAKKGDAVAQWRLGTMYDDGQGVPQDYVEAVKWYRKSAEQGAVYGQYNLGVMYEKGKGVPQDYAEAMKWYRKSAEQGNAVAQWRLGYMYASGQGVPQDYAEAVKWYRKSAEQGDAAGQWFLGVMYAKGQGVPQDYVEAHKWYNLAASRSTDKTIRDDATGYRDKIAAKVTPAQIAEAQKRASEWKPTK